MSSFEHNPEIRRIDLVSWTFAKEDYDQDRNIYIDPDNPKRSITANGARCLVRKLVAGFKALGLQPGDCVCVHAFNDIMYSMLFLGIIGAGGRFTGSNPAYTAAELGHHLRTSNTRFLVSEPELLPRIAPAIEECSLSVSDVLLFDPTGRDFPLYYRSWKELLDHGESDWIRFEDHEKSKNTTAALLSTSGTTGLPKAAMISHYSCVVQNAFLHDSKHKPYEVSRILTLPEFHAFAFPIAHIAPLREGIPTYIMRRFDLNRYLLAIQQYAITETPMVPQILRTIVEKPQLARDSLKSLRLVWSAGAPLSKSLQEEFYRLLNPNARVTQVWGMTEAGWVATFLWPEKDHTGSVGRLLPGMEAKLVHDDGCEIKADEVSAEILVRGPTIMQGYFGNTKATEDAFDAGGWLKTGDVGYKHQEKLYIVDRRKEMIKVRGWQVSPAELEAALLLHPHISDAAVIGVCLRQDEDTELPRAYVVRTSDCYLAEDEVNNFMDTKVARFKRLDGGVVFVDAIPRSSTGKILKNILRDQAAAGIKNAQTEDEKTPLALTTLPKIANRSTAPNKISANSSVISYDDAYFESRLRSRGNSASTVATTRSNSSNQTPGNGSLATATNENLGHNVKVSADTIPTDREPRDATDSDPRSDIEHSFAKRGKHPSPRDLSPLHTPVLPPPNLSTNLSGTIEASTKIFEAVTTRKQKRTGGQIEDSDANCKKQKFSTVEAASSKTIEKASNKAKAVEPRKYEA